MMTEISSNENQAGRKLLLVHGKDFKPAAEHYFDFAMAALAAGIERDYPAELDQFHGLSKRLCYYGDLTLEVLNRFGKQFDEVLDLGDRRNALAKMKLLDKRKQFGVGRYDRLPGKSAVTEFVVDIAAPMLAMLGFKKPLLARVSKDIAEYWNDKSSYAPSVRTRVLESLCEALDCDEKVLLITHGSGSIVAYDVLWQLSHLEKYASKYEGKKIDTWLTLGSPLGDSMVRRHLVGAKFKDRDKYPCNVVTWHNVSAEDDYLCHDNTLADDFKPMLKQRLVSSIQDYKIYNLSVRYGKSNPHSSLGYYIHPRVSQIIVEWLKSGSAAAERSPQNIL
jgi:hypothetical protein